MQGIDLTDDNNKSELSKARKVMNKLVYLLGTASIVTSIAAATVGERRLRFQSAIIKLYQELYPLKTMDDFDALRFGDVTYVRIYDMIKAARRSQA